jgi:hypothetical protein
MLEKFVQVIKNAGKMREIIMDYLRYKDTFFIKVNLSISAWAFASTKSTLEFTLTTIIVIKLYPLNHVNLLF